MGCRDIGGFVTPDRPHAKRELNEEQDHPKDRQSSKRHEFARVSEDASAKHDHCDSDHDGEKSVRHLQPDLKRIDIRQSARIAPGIDFCQR